MSFPIPGWDMQSKWSLAFQSRPSGGGESGSKRGKDSGVESETWVWAVGWKGCSVSQSDVGRLVDEAALELSAQEELVTQRLGQNPPVTR